MENSVVLICNDNIVYVVRRWEKVVRVKSELGGSFHVVGVVKSQAGGVKALWILEGEHRIRIEGCLVRGGWRGQEFTKVGVSVVLVLQLNINVASVTLG